MLPHCRTEGQTNDIRLVIDNNTETQAVLEDLRTL